MNEFHDPPDAYIDAESTRFPGKWIAGLRRTNTCSTVNQAQRVFQVIIVCRIRIVCVGCSDIKIMAP